MGLDAVNVDKSAVCTYESGVSIVRSGLGPFAVDESVLVPPGETMKIYWPDLIVPGCFGLLNFDGGDLATGELIDWIESGYDGEISLEPDGCLYIDGTTGWRAALKQSVLDRMNETMLICVYDEVSGEGSNGLFRVTGFIGVKLTYAKFTANDPYVEAVVERLVSVADCEIGTGVPLYNLCKVQLVE
jgi:hypothetical protein